MTSQDSTDRVEHLWILALAVCAIVGSFVLRQSAQGPLELPLAGIAEPLSLPDSCMSRRILGVSCPGCGLSRSFVAMSHGDLAAAMEFHVLGPCLYLLCWLQIPYRLGEYMGVGRFSRVWAQANRCLPAVTWAVILALFFTWVARIVMP